MGVPPTGLLISVIYSSVCVIFGGMCCSFFGSFSKTNVKNFEFDVFAWILCLGPYTPLLVSEKILYSSINTNIVLRKY